MHASLKPLLVATLGIAALAACKREADTTAPEAAPAPAAEAVAEPATPTHSPDVIQTTMAVSGVQPNANAPAWYDAKTFPGTFRADGASVTLNADGTYRASFRAESAGADLASEGTWNLEADGEHVLLDPNSKDEADRRFELVSAGEIKDETGGSLRRQ